MRFAVYLLAMATMCRGASYVGNDACRTCHPQIYERYRSTPMAQSSGRVTSTPAGSFRGALDFRVDEKGRASFGGLTRQLEWFIGSAAAGRSFAYSSGGHLYQAPLTYYSQRATWDASPGYGHDARWNRPIDSNCLFCHASQTRPIYGTQNRFADPPWTQDGVGCERCHGPGSDHVAGKSRMVNPAKLDPERRDAVCAQCHLSGEARIEKSDRSLAMFRPGDRLQEFVTYFVSASPAAVKATGYVERLQASRCKIASGDRLWCGSCHDPHGVPTVKEAAAYFRTKCLTCHTENQCNRGEDCRTCHLPRAKAVDGGHGVLTDHSIPRQVKAQQTAHDTGELQPFPGFTAGTRELGLAYAEVGLRSGNLRQSKQALELLSTVAGDRETLPRLADLHARNGDREGALDLYRRALAVNPNSVIVLVNLGALEAERGNTARAVELWVKALQSNPALEEAAANLRLILPADDPRQALVQRAQRLQAGRE